MPARTSLVPPADELGGRPAARRHGRARPLHFLPGRACRAAGASAMDLSEHFTFEELTRTDIRPLLDKNRKLARETPEVLANLTRVAKELLEPIRGVFQAPIQVNSGYRCPELNAAVGGSATSQHVRGEAADIVIRGYESEAQELDAVRRILKALPNLQFGQMLVEFGCIHVSLGSKREVAYYDVPTKTKRPIPPLG